MPSAVVLVIDGLGAKHLGPYGNTWLETPAFNRLATESLLVDGLFAPTPNLRENYAAWWTAGATSLVSKWNESGVHTHLVTDEPKLLDGSLAGPFAQQDQVDLSQRDSLSNEWDETHLAGFFAQAIQAVETAPDNSLVWLHSRGLYHDWDAPYGYRQQFVDDDDPEPSRSPQVPSLQLARDYDPDALHEIQCAFAGQVALVDQCVAVMASVMRDVAVQRDAIFMVGATRGFPLGEHLQVGAGGTNLLYHENLQLPAFVRYPSADLAMKRSGGLVTLSDLGECLDDWLLGSRPKHQFGGSNYAFSHAEEGYLLRTPVWQLRWRRITDDPELDREHAELYLKPDDRNEVNDVSGRCAAVIAAGDVFLREWLQSENKESLDVPEILLEPLE